MSVRREQHEGGRPAVAFILVAVAVAAFAGCASQPSGALACKRVALEPQPRWTFFGHWTDGGEELVIADVLAGRLLRYNRDGSHAGSVVRPGGGSLEFDRPIELAGAGSELILVNRTDHILGLSNGLEAKWGVHLQKLELEGGERLTFLRSVVPVGEQQLVGLLRLEGETTPWWGFGRVVLGSSPRVERILRLPSERTPAGDLYAMTMPLVARVGGAVYALRFEDEPHVQRLLPSPHRLGAFPSGEVAPVLPPNLGPNSTEGRYRAIENATMPTTLVGRGQFLYLLTRKPRVEGGTTWKLHQIDPEKDKLHRSMTLPTHASHLVVVPGPVDWAFIEKGPVGPGAEQHIGSMVLIPSTWIEDPTAGVLLTGDCLAGDAS
ncbi:MAG: hypothetical protein ABR517_00420 [Thermoanaerobaculia bacterium]